MNPFDFFKEIWCINLDHRTDRWEHAQQEFEKVGILNRVQRFSAIRHNEGIIGLTKSNCELLKYARNKKLENILILEDDIKFIMENNPIENLDLAIKQIKTPWQLFYLGANTHTKLTKISPNLIFLTNAYATHSVAYHKSVYDNFINFAENLKTVKKETDKMDVWLAHNIQAKQIALMVNPILTTQINSYSDIEKMVVNYSFIEERFKNNIK